MIVFNCPQLDRQTPAMRKRLERDVAATMIRTGLVNSASGMTAVLALQWCKTHGYTYKMTGIPDGYTVVERGEKIP